LKDEIPPCKISRRRILSKPPHKILGRRGSILKHDEISKRDKILEYDDLSKHNEISKHSGILKHKASRGEIL
jgi:hypothetical protein